MTTGTSQTNGIETAWRMDGPADGPVVLLSNSLMSNYHMWDLTVAALSDRYRVLRYDTRGHGRSGSTPGEYNVAQLADDAIALLDALKIERAHCVGLSLGGMICQQLGARYPQRVRSLGLCDTACEMTPRSAWEERIQNARNKGPAALADMTLQRWFTPAFHQREAAQVAAVRKMITDMQLEGYIGCASAVRDLAQSTMLLKISAPTLILTGRDDPSTTVEQATVLHRLIPQSELVVLDDAAHLSNIEQPEAFNRALRGFLDRTEARA